MYLAFSVNHYEINFALIHLNAKRTLTYFNRLHCASWLDNSWQLHLCWKVLVCKRYIRILFCFIYLFTVVILLIFCVCLSIYRLLCPYLWWKTMKTTKYIQLKGIITPLHALMTVLWVISLYGGRVYKFSKDIIKWFYTINVMTLLKAFGRASFQKHLCMTLLVKW